MNFKYQARTKAGDLNQGVVTAASQAKAEQLLTDNGLIIISLKEEKESILKRLDFLSNRVGYKDLVLFSRQFSTLVAARVPIVQSLRILQTQVSNKGLVTITESMVASIESGDSLSNALAKHPAVFGNIYVSLVRSGEASGHVAESLDYLADQLEKDYDLRSRVKSAMTYPVFVLSALVGVGGLMFKFVLPSLVSVLKEQGGELPLVSKILIQITDSFQVYWWVILLIIISVIVAGKYYVTTPAGRYMWDRLIMQIPVIGQVLEKVYLARFSRNFATLIAGGIPVIQALKIVAEIINNVIYRDILLEAVEQVTNGKTISDALARHKEFPPIVTQMVRVGEQTAQLDNILLKLAVFYEKEVDTKVATLSSLLEPIIMLVLGLGVGVLVAGVLLPIYNLASAV